MMSDDRDPNLKPQPGDDTTIQYPVSSALTLAPGGMGIADN